MLTATPAHNLVQTIALIALSCGMLLGQLNALAQNVPGVTYADQPMGIPSSTLVAKWPSLALLLDRGQITDRGLALQLLREQGLSEHATDGELNLLAQLEWQRGDLKAADAAIARAIALAPDEPLHAFQAAMVSFAHLRIASGFVQKWTWQRRTRDAYTRTFDLDPKNVSARYYLAYSYMNTPAIGGGDKDKALALANDGIRLSQNEFFAVRADAYRLRGEHKAAAADYDRSIELRVIKLGGFLDAASEALKLGDLVRAKKYYDWTAFCREDASGPFEGLGDYYSTTKDITLARLNYEKAIRNDPTSETVREKLSRLPAR